MATGLEGNCSKRENKQFQDLSKCYKWEWGLQMSDFSLLPCSDLWQDLKLARHRGNLKAGQCRKEERGEEWLWGGEGRGGTNQGTSLSIWNLRHSKRDHS